MNYLPALQFAGLLHLFVAAANFALPKMLHYRENLAKVSPIIRQIFLIHSLYIVIVLLGFGFLCLIFPQELAGASPLGRCLTAFLGLFWTLRIILQVVYYDHATKQKHPLGHLGFSAIFLYFAFLFDLLTFLAL